MLPWNFDIVDKWCYIRAKHWFIACSVRLKFVYRLYRLLFVAMVFWWLLLLRKKVDDVKEKGKDNITWKILNIEDLESGETPSVTWPWNEQWRYKLYKIKALWQSSSREMSGSIFCLAPACLHCISAFSPAPNNTSQVQIEGRVSLLSELSYLVQFYCIRSEFRHCDSLYITSQSKRRQKSTLFT